MATNLAVDDEVPVEGPYGTSFLRENMPARSWERRLPVGCNSPSTSTKAFAQRAICTSTGILKRWPNAMLTLSEATATGAWRTGWVTDAVGQDLADLDSWKSYVAGRPPWSTRRRTC
ncbi:hypothetical protein J7355_16060 [Endozoicomonas sp. G2_2]|uniref:hypothetical protein n=1 Tax=Endozoicomonas sp. G2_2 TaxID=2821092 RepID=UPI001ADADF8A|nr:hypothetical protein [Endozoicomonas sp. G2_2]MBO9471604.1 hypothetical protein [Endozoicomonas sp. G2_2]